MAAITHDPDRVLTPLRCTGSPGQFEAVSWEEALGEIAGRLRKILEADGAASVGVYTGNPTAFATLHYAYACLFVKALGADAKLFGAMHVDTGSKNLAQEVLFGSPATWTFPDLEDCDFLIILGANPLISHMSLISEPRVRDRLVAIHARGGVVVVDPRLTETARLFEHVAIRPDSDVWLLGAMLQHIFSQGLENHAYLEAKTSGWERLRDAVTALTPERASVRCGVHADTIRAMAERFARARTAACYGRVGTCRGRFSTLVNVFIEALNVVTGRFGASGGWVSGVSPIDDPNAAPPPTYGSERSRVGGLPFIMGFHPGGLIADEITTPGQGRLRALFVDSGNPINSYPDGNKLATALEQLDLMVALDFYVTETTRHADYILPTTTFFEREDITEMWAANAPRPWVQYSPAVLAPQGEARLEFDIYDSILQRLGRPNLFATLGTPDNPRPRLMEAIDVLLRAGVYGDKFGANPAGLTIAQLRENFPHGVRVAERVDAGASWNRVRTPDGKARLWHPVIAAEMARLEVDEPKSHDGTLLMIGRRKLGSMNSWMHNVERLVRSVRPTLLMHPDDASDRQILDGQRVKISSATTSLKVEVELSHEIVLGAVSYPHGWGNRGGWTRAEQLPGANINLLASARPEDWEQVTGTVHLDGIPVTVVAL